MLLGTQSTSFVLERLGLRNDNSTTVRSLLLSADAPAETCEYKLDCATFESIEMESSIKEAALTILPASSECTQALAAHVWKSCGIYRKLGHPGTSQQALTRLRTLLRSSRDDVISEFAPDALSLILLRLEDAKITSQKDLGTAIAYSKQIVHHLGRGMTSSGDVDRKQVYADALLLGGLWMAQENVATSTTILDSFFKKAAESAHQVHKKLDSVSSAHKSSRAFFHLGEFASSLYTSVEKKLNSDSFKHRVSVAQARKRQLETVTAENNALQREKKRTPEKENKLYEIRIFISTLEKEVGIDNTEIDNTRKAMNQYLQLAMESFCTALTLCGTSAINSSKHVFQLISLWFKNCHRTETKSIVNKIMEENIPKIPSYLFVPLTYQLFSHIDQPAVGGDSDDSFQRILGQMVFKICAEHPYHGLVQLIALSNGNQVGGRHASLYLDNVGDSKVKASLRIINTLRKHGPSYVKDLIGSYKIVMDDYIKLAMFDPKEILKIKSKGITFKSVKMSLNARHYDHKHKCSPAIITKPPHIQPNMDYGGGNSDPIGTERISGFESTFDLTDTGIHRPKIIICVGSRGGRFKQLVKGEDDLRQDAIMQQVFETVNTLLRREGASENEVMRELGIKRTFSSYSSKCLRVITYGITPLTPACGVLEWVNATMCFGDYINDKRKQAGAHSKYFPGEFSGNHCNKLLHGAPPGKRREVFDEICRNYSPSFRFFFLEHFSSSMEAWHSARTLYTRSCAVNSIVGHILGIGDRHCQNVLIHKNTGEMVQIDFGIVFEQGKALNTPETVPFRLTRNVVDGMGPSGTNGVFSKAAEATTAVLRKNADTLLTILSAVVADPLYKWNLTPAVARRRQQEPGGEEELVARSDLAALPSNNPDENRNDTADRAIAKIHEKLQGYEDGTSGELSTVAGQVQLLINEARNPDNLCVLFHGWQPWV